MAIADQDDGKPERASRINLALETKEQLRKKIRPVPPRYDSDDNKWHAQGTGLHLCFRGTRLDNSDHRTAIEALNAGRE